MNLKIIFIFILILFFISISSAESQLQINNVTSSTVERNLVIIIDTSGSTALGDATSGITFIGLIDANAINLIQNVASDIRVGVVAFSGITAQTDMLSMGSETNRLTLINFVKEIGPKGGENPTDLDLGLHAAENLLNLTSCKKEIIVISDGQISPDGFNKVKNKVTDLKNKGINIHFVQVLTSYPPSGKKEPYPLYNDLAQAANDQAIVLNPDERVNTPIFESKEPCTIPTPTTNPTVTTTQITTPTSIPTPQLEQEIKELKERLNKIEEKQNQSWFESSINSILGWFKSIL